MSCMYLRGLTDHILGSQNTYMQFSNDFKNIKYPLISMYFNFSNKMHVETQVDMGNISKFVCKNSFVCRIENNFFKFFRALPDSKKSIFRLLDVM